MTLYTIAPEQIQLLNNQPFWDCKYMAALNADSHPLSDVYDDHKKWIYVHEVELLTDPAEFWPHVFDAKSS